MTWLSDLVGQYRRRYLRQIAAENRIWTPRGPRAPGLFDLRLEKIYLDLRLSRGDAPRSSRSPRSLGALDLSGDLPLGDFLRRLEATDRAPPLVLLGAPGSGKSTMLRHAALTFATGRAGLRRAYIPILLAVRDHAAAIAGPNPPSLGELAEANIRAIPAHGPVPEGWFDKKLRRGRCVVLLDGLGEISPDEDRARAAAWIADQIAAYPGSLFVVTSRPAGYRTAPIPGAAVLEIQPFDAEEVQAFAERYYRENEVMRALGHEDEIIQRRAAQKTRDLLAFIGKRPALSALSRSPLLLTMLAMVHGTRGPTSSGRVELYAEMCQILLADLEDPAGAAADLAALASHMIDGRTREIPEEEATSVIDLARLREIEASSGLVAERENGRWAFAHRTFQEYLAAVHLRAEGKDLPFAALIEDAWWHEVLLIHAALGDATPLLEACLAYSTASALTLASECLEEADALDAEVRRKVEQRVGADAESADVERRRLTASVWLTRRTGSLSTIDARREIDLRFVTSAEYQLFLDDMRDQGELFHPDHWPHHRFLPGKAGEPVRGVRAEDAGRFARWLSRRRGGRATYRLPTADEARAYPAEEEGNLIAAWCKNGGRYRLIGLTAEEREDLVERLRPRSSIPPPPSLSFNVVRILDLTRDRDLDLDLAIVIALALAHAVTRSPPLDLGRRLILALARLRDRISARDLARALAHARARARELNLDRDQTMAVALRPAFDLLHDLARNRAQATLSLARAQQDRIALERARSLAQDLGEPEITAALDRKDFLAAHALTCAPTNPALERTRVMLQDLLTQLRADGPPELLKAQRLSDVRLVEYAWTASLEGAPAEAEDGADMARRTMAELSWWIHVILARRAQELPAWEGIRLVRERPLG